MNVMSENEKFLSGRRVRDRYGVTGMSIWRWLHDEEMKFPKPFFLGRFRFWKLSELEAWERSQPRDREISIEEINE